MKSAGHYDPVLAQLVDHLAEHTGGAERPPDRGRVELETVGRDQRKYRDMASAIQMAWLDERED